MYAFNVEDDLPWLIDLDKNTKHNIEKNIVDVIYESFVVTADQDYFTARLLAYNGLHRAFYWAAAQSIEKYLKAFLLFNGKSVKNYKSHPLDKLFFDACLFDRSLKNINISPIDLIAEEIEATSIFNIKNLDDFIQDLHNHGNADNRYNALGTSFTSNHIFALDNLAFSLRNKIGVPSFSNSFKQINFNSLEIFSHNNPLFLVDIAKLQQTEKLSNLSIFSDSVTKLEFLIKNNFTNELKWLGTKMKMPKY